jgi:mono/diheme cytochrome c family protein
MRKSGIAILISFGALLTGCALYAGHMVRQGFSTRTPPSNVEAIMATTMLEASVPARYKTMRNPVAATPEAIHDGLAHYADHCAVCHANNGSGQSMIGKTMYPRPPNLAGKETQSMSDGEIYYPIQYGIRLSGMPAFGEPVDTDEESWKLVAFVRHLPKLNPEEEREMEHLNPKGPDEWQEEKAEEQFLDSGEPPAKTSTPHHLKGHRQ